jgi:ubiquinone/menaquinone biosynthesis C-methylase UbiE
MRTLTRQKAKEFYDRFGKKQDWQGFYEDRPVQALIRHGEFGSARAVLEFGCGTGRFAVTLLEKHMPSGSRFVGVDISETMVSLAKTRLERFGDRAKVILTDGSPRLDFSAAAFDRFVSCYVLDLLSSEDIGKILQEAERLLSPGGLLCLVSLTRGFTFFSRIVERAWQALFKFRPGLVGGCRPVRLFELVSEPTWQLLFHDRYSSFGIPSEVLIARKVSGNQPG